MKNFIPKDYLGGNITENNCKHQLLATSGSTDYVTGSSYDCIICGKHLHYGPNEFHNFNDKYMFYHFGALTVDSIQFHKDLLNHIALRYESEDSIDIVGIFKALKPHTDKMIDYLNTKTEKERAR